MGVVDGEQLRQAGPEAAERHVDHVVAEPDRAADAGHDVGLGELAGVPHAERDAREDPLDAAAVGLGGGDRRDAVPCHSPSPAAAGSTPWAFASSRLTMPAKSLCAASSPESMTNSLAVGAGGAWASAPMRAKAYWSPIRGSV
jgi:hypothetical protein